MSRLLGIDLGSRRIGLAVGDTELGRARPLATVRRGKRLDDDAATLSRIVAEQRVEELVVGLPLEASGEEGPMAREARGWAREIGLRLRIPVRLRDERLSSIAAEERLGPMRRGRSGGPPKKVQRDAYRARVDREAAVTFLQAELDSLLGDRANVPGMSDDVRVTDPETSR